MTTTSTQPDPTSPDSPPTPPASPTRLVADHPGFQSPPAPPTPRADPIPAEGATTRPLSPSEIDYVTDSGPGPSRSTSKTDPIGPSQVFTGDPAAFEGLIATGVMVAGSAVDWKLSPHTHTWLPNQAEAEAIAEPLARIAARHTPAVGGGETNDILDGLEAGLAVGGYALRARNDSIRARQAEQQAAQNDPGRW